MIISLSRNIQNFQFPFWKCTLKSLLSDATYFARKHQKLSLLRDYKLLLFLVTSTFQIELYKELGRSLLAERLAGMHKAWGSIPGIEKGNKKKSEWGPCKFTHCLLWRSVLTGETM